MAGGIKTGWQTVLRASDPYGPYEERVVMAQGKTKVNGPHQGGWVETQNGEFWFVHFQDIDAYGRVVHLQPMVWKDGWPIIGEAKKKDTVGNPVTDISYSLNGKTWHKIDVNGADYKFKARPGRWIGAKAGLYCNRFHSKNDSGWVEADWFRISR